MIVLLLMGAALAVVIDENQFLKKDITYLKEELSASNREKESLRLSSETGQDYQPTSPTQTSCTLSEIDISMCDKKGFSGWKLIKLYSLDVSVCYPEPAMTGIQTVSAENKVLFSTSKGTMTLSPLKKIRAYGGRERVFSEVVMIDGAALTVFGNQVRRSSTTDEQGSTTYSMEITSPETQVWDYLATFHFPKDVRDSDFVTFDRIISTMEIL